MPALPVEKEPGNMRLIRNRVHSFIAKAFSPHSHQSSTFLTLCIGINTFVLDYINHSTCTALMRM